MRVSIPRLLLLIAIISLPLAAGCGQREEIRTYPVAKEEEKVADVATQPRLQQEGAEATDRMLVAVLPVANQAWFFKVAGTIADVNAREDEINKFFQDIRVVDGRPRWELPEGWKEEPSNSMFRLATIWIPTDGKPLELTVSQLGWQGDEAMLPNVNRWRGQMQLPPIGERQLAEETRQIQAGEHTMTIVDLRGEYSGGMPPFAGGARGAGRGGELPPGHPPINQETPDGNQ